MNKHEARTKWVEALRSGEYDQCRGSLKETDFDTNSTSYCCLGVACEVAVQEGIIEGYLVDDGLPPEEVVEWLGLGRGEERDEVTNKTIGHFVYLNDSMQLSFNEIADAIEAL